MSLLSLTPLLALQVEVIKLVIVALVMLGGPLLKMVSEARQRAERAKNPPSQPGTRTPPVRTPPTAAKTQPVPPSGDNRFRNEIEVFLEEVGRRRASSDPAARTAPTRGTAPVQPPVVRQPTRPQPARVTPRASSSASQAKAEPPKPKAEPDAGPSRPGAEIAARKAPVSDDLGAQIRTHLSQYLESSRMSQRAQADLGNAVERAVREHLGTSMTPGSANADQGAAVPAASANQSINDMLRNPSGVRTAIMINEILERPKFLRRKS